MSGLKPVHIKHSEEKNEREKTLFAGAVMKSCLSDLCVTLGWFQSTGSLVLFFQDVIFYFVAVCVHVCVFGGGAGGTLLTYTVFYLQKQRLAASCL